MVNIIFVLFNSGENAMRGPAGMQETLLTAAKLDDLFFADHTLVKEAPSRLNELSNDILGDTGRASIVPETLIRGRAFELFYSIKSKRQLCEQPRYNLPFRWFVRLKIDDAV